MSTCLRLDVMKNHSFQWTFIPWVTFSLAALICGIHIFAWLTGSSSNFEKSFGVVSGEYHTYITYAFLHDDWSHLAANTTLLVIFGSLLEQQVRRFYYISLIVLSILLAAVFGQHFPYPATLELTGPIVGLSGATWATKVASVGILIRHWNRVGACIWFATLVYLEVIAPVSAYLAIACLLGLLGLMFSGVRRHVPARLMPYIRHSRRLLQPYWVIPSLLASAPLIDILIKQFAYPGGVGHLTGALIGLLFLYLVKDRITTDRIPYVFTLTDRAKSAFLRVTSGRSETLPPSI